MNVEVAAFPNRAFYGHNTMLRELHEDALYLAVPVPGGTVGNFVSAAKTIGIQGFNLTMPHKEDILPYLSRMTPEAERCHSVNSVRQGIGF